MRGLQLVPYDTKIDFSGRRFLAYGLAIAIIIVSFTALFTKGLNYGIDFKGGLLIEIRTPEKADIAGLRSTLNDLGLGEVKLQDFGTDRDVLIRIEQQDGGEKAQVVALQMVKSTLGDKVDYRRVETVGAKVSADLIKNGIMAVIFAMVGMLIYIWIRFEWEYGVCGILALAHDAIAVLGFYAISGFEFNETAFAALLTTVGYSINDTVVIYDRLREDLRKFKTTPLGELVNLSANGTLSRTVLTSGSTLLALFALYIFGG
ncbi:MAG TPA: protein translocase subunit SecF, partial [Holosporales bacterium]|nr:protein translocase subunit SecF [Holosporales bacterium]